MDASSHRSEPESAIEKFPYIHGVTDQLSPRQREVFHWICEGKRDREIATILGISYRTVTVHVRAILAKLGVENRTCAAMLSKGANGNNDIPASE